MNLELEEKVHDLAMARNNIEQLKVMLEEKSSTSESNQMERLQNIAGINIYLSICNAPNKVVGCINKNGIFEVPKTEIYGKFRKSLGTHFPSYETSWCIFKLGFLCRNFWRPPPPPL